MEINPIKIENTIEDLLCDTKNAQYTHMPTPTILLEALLALPSFTNKYKKNKMTLINNESLHDTINISRKLQNTSHLEEVYLIFSDAGLRLQLQNPNPNLFVTSFLKRSCFTTLRMPSSNPSRCISITIKLPEFIAAVRSLEENSELELGLYVQGGPLRFRVCREEQSFDMISTGIQNFYQKCSLECVFTPLVSCDTLYTNYEDNIAESFGVIVARTLIHAREFVQSLLEVCSLPQAKYIRINVYEYNTEMQIKTQIENPPLIQKISCVNDTHTYRSVSFYSNSTSTKELHSVTASSIRYHSSDKDFEFHYLKNNILACARGIRNKDSFIELCFFDSSILRIRCTLPSPPRNSIINNTIYRNTENSSPINFDGNWVEYTIFPHQVFDST